MSAVTCQNLSGQSRWREELTNFPAFLSRKHGFSMVERPREPNRAKVTRKIGIELFPIPHEFISNNPWGKPLLRSWRPLRIIVKTLLLLCYPTPRLRSLRPRRPFLRSLRPLRVICCFLDGLLLLAGQEKLMVIQNITVLQIKHKTRGPRN